MDLNRPHGHYMDLELDNEKEGFFRRGNTHTGLNYFRILKVGSLQASMICDIPNFPFS